jgi:LuxR family transcriptional regulator, maltose regulon positive regulatory protein
MIGGAMLERRRFLALASRAAREYPERFTTYVQAVAAMVRAVPVDGDVSQAVLEGRRAVAIAEAGADEVLVAAFAGYARALYLAGDLDQAWNTAMRAVEHPGAERWPHAHAFARSTLALVAADCGWLASGRTHAEKAKSIIGGVASSRTWLGANASVALGMVLLGEGRLTEAERELAYAEHFFRDEVATVHHAWAMVVLARIRCRRGRIAEAEVALLSAQESIGQLADAGGVATLAADVNRELTLTKERALGGAILEPPSAAELSVLRLLVSDLSARQIGEQLCVSPNTVRSHTRSIYHKLGVCSRADAVARAESLGLLAQAQPPL